MSADAPRVLVVEDERDLADLYATWLRDRYDTDVSYSGIDAQERLREGGCDVVLLDRRMPDLSGGDVLATIREHDLDCRVAMVTAVSPDFDIIEMGFDSYVVKPVTAEDLYDVVDRLHNLTAYERQVQRLYALTETRSVLEAEKTPEELDASEEYSGLNEEIATLQAASRSNLETIDEGDLRSVMQSLSSTDEEEPAR